MSSWNSGASQVKNIFDVLRQKEAQLQELQKEIEALRLAARLLSAENEKTTDAVEPAAPPAVEPRQEARATEPKPDVYRREGSVGTTLLRQFP